MQRFSPVPTLALALALAFSAACRSAPTPPAKSQRQAGLNVLLVTVDTLRADAPGFAGKRPARTPTLDRLAAGGVRFTRAFAHNVVTLPSHATILSGRLPVDHGVHDNSGARFPNDLDTLATLLNAKGYRTGAFVSAFPLESRFGLARGFEVYDDQFADAARPAFLEQERPGAETVARAQAWLAAQDPAQPFFCWVHVYEPHFPYQPDYDSDVAAADAALGPLLEPFLNGARAERTVTIVTSDHGESLGEHGEATHGVFAYDATLRVPLVLHAPRLWSPRVVESVASHADILPTVLDALAIDIPRGVAGTSLLPVASGERIADRPLYFEALSASLTRGWAPLRGTVVAGWKLIDLPVPELYDLTRDPEERRNLIDAEGERAREMRARLQQWVARERAVSPVAEAADVRERLRSLGYTSGRSAPKRVYTAQDDPKHLIALDRRLQEVVGLYVDGRLPEALARCRELVASRPDMAVSLLHLAHLERESGHLDAGIGALQRALALDPNAHETAALLAGYLVEAGRAREAVSLLEPFAARPDPDVQVLMTGAIALSRSGRSDEAISQLQRAQQLDPSSAGIHVHKGTVLLMAGRTPQARAAFEEALAINPSQARAHSSLAAMAAGEGNRDAALAHWRAATNADPAEFRTVLEVAAALSRSGRAEAARPYFEFFVTSAPADRYARERARAREWLAARVQ